jgi:DNA-binding NarL/FixJ family response regulator
MSIQGRPVRQPVEALVVHITPWERATLQLLADGTSTSVLADRFQTSEADLEARLATLFGRMGVRSRAEAIRAAVRRGLVTAALRVGET